MIMQRQEQTTRGSCVELYQELREATSHLIPPASSLKWVSASFFRSGNKSSGSLRDLRKFTDLWSNTPNSNPNGSPQAPAPSPGCRDLPTPTLLPALCPCWTPSGPDGVLRFCDSSLRLKFWGERKDELRTCFDLQEAGPCPSKFEPTSDPLERQVQNRQQMLLGNISGQAGFFKYATKWGCPFLLLNHLPQLHLCI